MNSKGFTLVELLATITIMGIIMAFAFPAITKLRSQHASSEYIAYEKSMLYAAKIYHEDHVNRTRIYESDLVSAKLIKKYNKANTDCSSSYIVVTKKNQTFKYTPYVYCTRNGKVVYRT